jgi:hypothetical protein
MWIYVVASEVLLILIIVYLREDRKDLKAKLARAKASLNELESEYLDAQMINGASDEVNEEMVDAFTTLADEIKNLLADLGIEEIDLPSSDELFSEMSQDLRQKLAAAHESIFQEGTAELINRSLDAMTQYEEIRYRLQLFKERLLSGHAQLTINAKIGPENLDAVLKGVLQIEEVLSKYERLKGPAKALGEIVTAAVMEDYVLEVQGSLGRSDPAAVCMVKEILAMPAPVDDEDESSVVEGIVMDINDDSVGYGANHEVDRDKERVYVNRD